MRVAVDATPLTLSSGGLARYTSELVRALAAQFPEDDYSLVGPRDRSVTVAAQTGFGAPHKPSRDLSLDSHGAVPAPANILNRRWWLWGVQREMNRLRSEVFHGTNFEVPYLPTRPSVMSLHDLSPWMDPAWHHAADRVRRRTPLLIRLGVATMIVTDSEAVRRQAIDAFRIHPGRIVSVPLAAAAHFRPIRSAPPARPYFLYVGALEPRKNIPFLVDAWQ